MSAPILCSASTSISKNSGDFLFLCFLEILRRDRTDSGPKQVSKRNLEFTEGIDHRAKTVQHMCMVFGPFRPPAQSYDDYVDAKSADYRRLGSRRGTSWIERATHEAEHALYRGRRDARSIPRASREANSRKTHPSGSNGASNHPKRRTRELP